MLQDSNTILFWPASVYTLLQNLAQESPTVSIADSGVNPSHHSNQITQIKRDMFTKLSMIHVEKNFTREQN